MKKFLLATAAIVAVASFAQDARASAALQLTSGLDSVTIQDNGVGDANPLAGVITFVGTVGAFDLNVTTGSTYPAFGSAAVPSMDLNSVNGVFSPVAASLTMMFTQTGFSAAPGNFDMNVGGTLAAGSAATFTLYSGASNTQFDLGSQIGTMAFTNNSLLTSAFSNDILGAGPAVAPYSLTQVATITTGATGGLSSFDYASQIRVPEPASMALLGAGLLGLGFARRRRG